jgi:uncharacterized Zn-finger protein
MLIHSKEKKFRCGVCTSGFNYKDNLNKHLRTHQGPTPHKCPVCNVGFSSILAVRAHVASVHTKRPKTEPSQPTVSPLPRLQPESVDLIRPKREKSPSTIRDVDVFVSAARTGPKDMNNNQQPTFDLPSIDTSSSDSNEVEFLCEVVPHIVHHTCIDLTLNSGDED